MDSHRAIAQSRLEHFRQRSNHNLLWQFYQYGIYTRMSCNRLTIILTTNNITDIRFGFSDSHVRGAARTKEALQAWSCCRASHGELINDQLFPTPPRTWHKRTGDQLKTWSTTIKADLEPLSGPRVFGHARWRKDCESLL